MKKLISVFGVAILIGVISTTTIWALTVTLGWDPNSETDLAGYRIYYCQTNGGPYEGSDADEGASPIDIPINFMIIPEAPEYSLNFPDPCASYFFVATAYNDAGEESGYSNQAAKIQICQLPPTADAGSDTAVTEGDLVNLNGATNDEDGTVTGILWTQISGPTAEITNYEILTAHFYAPEVETQTILVFRLSVQDNSGLEASDDITVMVNPVVGFDPCDVNHDSHITLADKSYIVANKVDFNGDGKYTTMDPLKWNQLCLAKVE